MRIYEFLLEEFKPLLHNNIHKIHVTNISQITILTGPNGWGKSSILRELTPYAATRSDYNKNGKKILYVSHDKSNYILTSDFSKTNAHSFIKDDLELNLSGTTDVQNDLVNTYFEYSKLLDNLLLGNMKITNMGRPARKELFMATYPGSLAFVLNHFNRLASLSRTTAGQLKLFKERQAKIINKLIPQETLKTYSELKADLDKMVIQFDQNIFMCNNMLKTILSSKGELSDCSSFSLTFFNNRIDELKESLNILKTSPDYDIIDGNMLQFSIMNTNNILQSLTNEHKSLLQLGIDIKEEMEKYNQYLNMDIKDSIKRCEIIIEMQTKILEERAIDPDIPIMDMDTLEYIKPKLNDIEGIIQWLSAFGKHWTKEEHRNKQLEYAKLQMEVSRLESRHTDLLNNIGRLTAQLDSVGVNQYPKDCNRTCMLRDNIEKTVKNITDEITEQTKLKDKIFEELKTSKKASEELKLSFEGRSTAEAKIDTLERLISHYQWGFFICNNSTLISSLNSNPIDVWNRLLKVINNSQNAITVKKAKETLEVTKAKLDNLKITDIPAKTIITETLLKKEVELKKIHTKLDNITKKGKLLQARKIGYTKQLNILNEIRQLNTQLKKWIDYKKLEADQQLLTDIIDDLTINKTIAHEKLRSIESIIIEQQGYLTILHDELTPTINELEEKLRRLELIAEQLSPTSGIPYKYSIQYINDLFKLANKFIKHIWEYEIELIYFKDKDNFDFIFKLLINNASELKDINMCSKGQKSLIDLVVNLAICIYRGYSQTYPLKLDEIDDGMTPTHQAKLTEFLGELLQQNTINQVFIMNHQLSVSSSFQNAGVISLSAEDIVPTNCKVISKIN